MPKRGLVNEATVAYPHYAEILGEQSITTEVLQARGLVLSKGTSNRLFCVEKPRWGSKNVLLGDSIRRWKMVVKAFFLRRIYGEVWLPVGL